MGLGYVGLPTALSFARVGRRVLGYDVDPARLGAIRSGNVDSFEEDAESLATALDTGAFRLSDDPRILEQADGIIICVPTPVDENLVPDLSIVRSACATAVEHAHPGQVLILTSTTYVGCTDDLLVAPLEQRGFTVGQDINVCFSPERINPGSLDRPEQTPRVIGGATEKCVNRGSELLSPTCALLHRVTSLRAAELTKLLENTYRAVNIAFINEMADIAHELGVPISEVIDAAATKPYGYSAFRPGPGIGGHCIPVDPHYLLWQLKSARRPAPIIESVMSGVAARPRRVKARLVELLAAQGQPLVGAHIHLWGVAYKPGVADVRESPALEILTELVSSGARVTYSDPRIPHVSIRGVRLAAVEATEAQAADITVALTIHPEDDLSILRASRSVLDTTYGLPPGPSTATL